MVDLRDLTLRSLVLKNVGFIRMRGYTHIVDLSLSSSEFSGNKYQVMRENCLYDLEFDQGGYISWHFHPSSLSDFKEPHMHIYPERKIHVPCVRFYLCDVVQLCLEYLILRGQKVPYRDWERRLKLLRTKEEYFAQTSIF